MPTLDERTRVRATAPGRVCLAGESLDWMTGGASVVAAVPLRTSVTIRTGDEPGPVILHAAAPLWMNRNVAIRELSHYQHDELDHLQAPVQVLADRCGDRLNGALVQSSTELPIAAGVSSSAAVTIAASAALLLLADRTLPSPAAISEAAYQAEAQQLATGAGWMDFLACTYGGVNKILSNDAPTATRLRDTIGVPMILIDTGQRHSTADVASKRDRFRSGEPGIRSYVARTPTIVDALVAALEAEKPDYAAVGTLLTEAHGLLRDLVHSSTPLIEECVARCLAAGAYGAKLSGSGHGGCLFALCPWDALEAVRSAVAELPVRVMVFTSGEPHGIVFLPSDHYTKGNLDAGSVQAHQSV